MGRIRCRLVCCLICRAAHKRQYKHLFLVSAKQNYLDHMSGQAVSVMKAHRQTSTFFDWIGFSRRDSLLSYVLSNFCSLRYAAVTRRVCGKGAMHAMILTMAPIVNVAFCCGCRGAEEQHYDTELDACVFLDPWSSCWAFEGMALAPMDVNCFR